ncbi:hypothetical protein E2562_025675, partial [Oryza meyeriana var. granulata]
EKRNMGEGEGERKQRSAGCLRTHLELVEMEFNKYQHLTSHKGSLVGTKSGLGFLVYDMPTVLQFDLAKKKGKDKKAKGDYTSANKKAAMVAYLAH